MSAAARSAAPDGAWLLLWDIDGTLLLKASGSHAAAVWDALREVHGVEGAEMPKSQPLAGMTDGQISRDILTAAGVADAPETAMAYIRAVAPEGSDGVEDDAGLLTADDKRNTPIKVSGETCGRTLLKGVTFQNTPA